MGKPYGSRAFLFGGGYALNRFSVTAFSICVLNKSMHPITLDTTSSICWTSTRNPSPCAIELRFANSILSMKAVFSKKTAKSMSSVEQISESTSELRF